MADNFLERHREEYEERKQRWLLRKQTKTVVRHRQIERPEDEAL